MSNLYFSPDQIRADPAVITSRLFKSPLRNDVVDITTPNTTFIATSDERDFDLPPGALVVTEWHRGSILHADRFIGDIQSRVQQTVPDGAINTTLKKDFYLVRLWMKILSDFVNPPSEEYHISYQDAEIRVENLAPKRAIIITDSLGCPTFMNETGLALYGANTLEALQKRFKDSGNTLPPIFTEKSQNIAKTLLEFLRNGEGGAYATAALLYEARWIDGGPKIGIWHSAKTAGIGNNPRSSLRIGEEGDYGYNQQIDNIRKWPSIQTQLTPVLGAIDRICTGVSPLQDGVFSWRVQALKSLWAMLRHIWNSPLAMSITRTPQQAELLGDMPLYNEAYLRFTGLSPETIATASKQRNLFDYIYSPTEASRALWFVQDIQDRVKSTGGPSWYAENFIAGGAIRPDWTASDEKMSMNFARWALAGAYRGITHWVGTGAITAVQAEQRQLEEWGASDFWDSSTSA